MNVAERITITVPDDLHKRLQEVKEKLNVSRICSRAIEEAIELEELKLTTDISDKEKAIKRLRIEKKQEVSTNWKKKGLEEGMNDAQNTLKYSQIKLILLSDKQDIIAQPRKYLNSEIWQRFRKYLSDDEFDKDAYVEGWIKGVTRFWEEVKDEL